MPEIHSNWRREDITPGDKRVPGANLGGPIFSDPVPEVHELKIEGEHDWLIRLVIRAFILTVIVLLACITIALAAGTWELVQWITSLVQP